METEKLLSSSAATVRLIPSIVIEPFSTISLRMSSAASIFTHVAFPSRRVSETTPIPSICPDTMCPPNLPSAAMALSRFTRSPDLSLPRLLRRKVSGITSAVKPSLNSLVTVRQTPFTAIESPILVPSRTFAAPILSSPEVLPETT